MTTSFLTQYFRQGTFPSPVLALIIRDYGSRYGDVLAMSKFLGDQVRDLLPVLSTDQRVSLARKSENALALDLLLASPTTHADVLKGIGDAWSLSDADQHRFLERDISKVNYHNLLVHLENTDYVVGVWKSRFNYDPATHNIKTVMAPDVSTPKKRPPGRMSLAGCFSSEPTVAELANVISGLAQYNENIEWHLGDGSTERSLDAWRTFFGLAESDPGVKLETVLRTASRLALATA